MAKTASAAKKRAPLRAKTKAAPPRPSSNRMAHGDVAAKLVRRKVSPPNGHSADSGRSGMHGTHLAPAIRPAPATHKFRAGQTVTLLPNRYGSNRNGSFEVMRLLPEEHGVRHYRLKSVADGHERVAGEDELI